MEIKCKLHVGSKVTVRDFARRGNIEGEITRATPGNQKLGKTKVEPTYSVQVLHEADGHQNGDIATYNHVPESLVQPISATTAQAAQ